MSPKQNSTAPLIWALVWYSYFRQKAHWRHAASCQNCLPLATSQRAKALACKLGNADAQLPPCIHFDGLERDDNTRLTWTVPGTEIGSTVFGTQFPGKRIIRIRHDLRPCSDFQGAVRIGCVKDKECAFRMRLEIFQL